MKSLKKIIKKVGKVGKTVAKAAIGGPAGILGALKKPGHTDQELGMRASAAANMIKKPVKKQAGQGQIDYMGEFYE